MASERQPTGCLKPLLTVVVATVVGLLLGEGLARVMAEAPTNPRQARYAFEPGPDGGPHRFKPSSSTTWRWDGDPFGTLPPGAALTVKVNAQGLRGPEPGAGARPVLLVGDSFTFGEGVADDATFAQALRRGRVVVNAGVPGYGTADQLARIDAWLEAYKPRAVVVVFVPNDPIPLEDSLARSDDLMNRRTQQRSSSRLLELLSRRREEAETLAWYRSYYDGPKRERWRQARQALLDMASRAKKAGAQVGFVWFPLLVELDTDAQAPMRDLFATAAKDAGAAFLDLTPALSVEPASALWVHPTDHHPNARAHALAAGALGPFIDGLVP